MEGLISVIQVTLNRRPCDHRMPNDGIERNPYRNLRVLCRRLCLRCLGWLSRTRELGPLRGWPRSRPLGFGGGWHKVSGWPSGGIPALRRCSTLRWGNGGVLSRWRSGASNGGLCWSRYRRGWGCGKTSPSLCHGRNAWKKTDQILERWRWHTGLVSLWLLYFKGLNRNGGLGWFDV